MIMKVKEYIEKNGMVNFEKRLTKKGREKVDYPNWIITDTRFPNELEAVKERNGVTIRVNRTNPQDGSVYGWGNPNILHESEIALDGVDFDYEIENNGTIPELIFKVRQILNIEGLI